MGDVNPSHSSRPIRDVALTTSDGPRSTEDPPATSTRASMPPSEPRPSRGSFSMIEAQADHPARFQMIVALILGLVLVAIPLYLWRRPRSESIAASASSATPVAGVGSGEATAGGASPTTAAVSEPKLVLSEARVVACHDPGPKKTTSDQCDRLELEKAFAKAIDESAGCVPKDAGGGTIAYVADVSFKKKNVALSTPKEGRTLKNAKVVAACLAAVKGKLPSSSLEGMAHQHARYKIQITATYPGAVK